MMLVAYLGHGFGRDRVLHFQFFLLKIVLALEGIERLK